jgi:hypothetical protein
VKYQCQSSNPNADKSSLDLIYFSHSKQDQSNLRHLGFGHGVPKLWFVKAIGCSPFSLCHDQSSLTTIDLEDTNTIKENQIRTRRQDMYYQET